MNIPFFGSKKSGGGKSAKELISAAYNVYNYRCDVMGEENAQRLHDLIVKTEGLFDDGKADSDEYKKTAEELERLMRKHGGMVYPLGFWSDNVDVVIVAGILALTVRSFFVQTFQIPTNSMHPTYFGMTPRVYSPQEAAPSGISKLGRLVFKGASNYRVEAPESGEAFIEINRPEMIGRNRGIFRSETRPSRWLGVLPSSERVYFFLAGGKPVELALPPDFAFEGVMQKAYPFGSKSDDTAEYFNAIASSGRVVERNGRLFLPLGSFKKGSDILNFDILAGDMLLVDRFTYNFRKPRVGDPIVFRTGQIEGMKKYSEGDKYYIKRLVGEGGDTLRIEGTTLVRNGAPITGSPVFAANAGQVGEYPGYRKEESLKDGKSVKVPPRHYFAMGDNSASSLDSRYWGPLPEGSVVGKPLVIFYPFTERWGAAK